MSDAGPTKVDLDVESVGEMVACSPGEKSTEHSLNELADSIAKKEIERYKISAEAKMKIRQRKISRLESAAEEQAAKMADLAARLEEVTQDKEALEQDKTALQATVA